MKNSYVRFITLYIALFLFFVTYGGPFSAAENFQMETESQTIIPLSDIPEVLTMADILERGHTERLRAEETDMHSIVFKNEDGTKSLYVFASPVKYEASDGTIKDKRTTITQTPNAYVVTDNDVLMSFGKTSGDGAELQYESTTVSLTPLSDALDSAAMISENTLLYDNAFGTNTMVSYAPLMSGMKSTIIIKAPISNPSFSYKLDMSGIANVSKGDDGVIKLSDSDGKTIYNIGIYIATDANGKTVEGEMRLEQEENGKYTVTADVDNDFLLSEDTEYPVMVEPTITVNTSSAINDAVIYSNKPNKNYGAYNYHNIGKFNDSYGTGRLLVSFPGLKSNVTYQSLSPAQIRKAEYNMFFASSTDANFWVNAYRQNLFAWEENTITWNQTVSYTTISTENVLMYSSSNGFNNNTGVNGGERLSINLTGVIRDELRSSRDISNSVIIQNKHENMSGMCIDMCSTEYADSHNGNYMPYLTIDYATSGDYIPINFKIYVDSSFAARCRVMNVSIQSRLDALMSDTVNKFRNDFGIEINYTFVLYETPADTSNCPKKSDIGQLCDCYDSCGMHHTNQDYLMQNFPISDTDVCFNMLMTGRKTCHENVDGSCNGGYTRLGVCYGDDYIGIFCTDKYHTSDDEEIQMVIFHEIAHLYKIEDHYNKSSLETGQSDSCIYGNNRFSSSCVSDLALCDYCRNTIENNITNYYHE